MWLRNRFGNARVNNNDQKAQTNNVVQEPKLAAASSRELLHDASRNNITQSNRGNQNNQNRGEKGEK